MALAPNFGNEIDFLVNDIRFDFEPFLTDGWMDLKRESVVSTCRLVFFFTPHGHPPLSSIDGLVSSTRTATLASLDIPSTAILILLVLNQWIPPLFEIFWCRVAQCSDANVHVSQEIRDVNHDSHTQVLFFSLKNSVRVCPISTGLETILLLDELLFLLLFYIRKRRRRS